MIEASAAGTGRQRRQGDGSIRPDVDTEGVCLTVNAALEGFLTQQLEPPPAQRRWIAKFRSLMEDVL